MSLNLAPWYYRNLLGDNSIIEKPVYYEVVNVIGDKYFETNITLKNIKNSYTVSQSEIYNNCDGSGADKYKNISAYKAISEALERLAFYETIDINSSEFSFNLNPTTTGMAAYPHFNYSRARTNAKHEAIERWAIHQFNKSMLPILNISSSTPGLNHYEIITPFRSESQVSLISYKFENFHCYSFAADKTLDLSFNKALVELNRNLKILIKNNNFKKNYTDFKDPTDRTLLYYSSVIGYEKFNNLLLAAPRTIHNLKPKILTDKPIEGRWTQYTKVWRFVLEDSYFPCHEDHTFFMF